MLMYEVLRRGIHFGHLTNFEKNYIYMSLIIHLDSKVIQIHMTTKCRDQARRDNRKLGAYVYKSPHSKKLKTNRDGDCVELNP